MPGFDRYNPSSPVIVPESTMAPDAGEKMVFSQRGTSRRSQFGGPGFFPPVKPRSENGASPQLSPFPGLWRRV